jgi:hypothetical protein
MYLTLSFCCKLFYSLNVGKISILYQGLVAVFEELSDTIEHRLCLRHLYANFKKRFGGGALIRDLMMGAAKATYYQAWVQKMNELKNADPNAWTWLMAVPTKSWCKHAFSFYPKCDTLMNNISESFNATILAARDKPILTMCEWIRKYLMNRLSTSASKLENWPHKVMPIPRRRLDNEVFRSGHWLPTWSIAETFQVTHSYNTHEFIVDIAKRSCSCNFWELVGIPCRHAVAALSYRKQNPDEFVDACYTREKFALCYGFSVSPINGQDMWPEVEMEPPLPPAYKNGPGRPKKIRIRESGEDGARKRRSGVAYKCTKCDNFGHNAMTCKATTQDPNALKRKVIHCDIHFVLHSTFCLTFFIVICIVMTTIHCVLHCRENLKKDMCQLQLICQLQMICQLHLICLPQLQLI